MSLFNNNGNLPTRQDSQTLRFSLPEGVINFLEDKLKKVQTLIIKHKNGDIRKMPAATLGNRHYAYLREKRIQSAIKALLQSSSTLLFITITRRYDQKNLKESWLYFKKELPKFIRKLRKFGGSEYIYVKEAHYKGGCHVHLCIAWKKVLKEKKHPSKNKILLGDKQLREKIKENWEGHIDIEIVKDEKAGEYLTKELGKASHIETALKKHSRGEATKADIKKLWVVFWAKKLSLRLVGTSRNIPVIEPSDSEQREFEFITNKNNTTEENPIIKIIPAPWWLKKHPVYTPYSGKVKPESPEYILLSNFLIKPCPD